MEIERAIEVLKEPLENSADYWEAITMAIEALQKESSDYINLTDDRRPIYTDCIADCIHYDDYKGCDYNKTCLRLGIDYYMRRDAE